ncbi:hypothetical protein D3C87_1837920 [compost metagenome]
MKCFEEQPNHLPLIQLLGDVCYRSGYYQDAQLFYTKLLDMNHDYSTYERCFNLYEKTDDVQGMLALKAEISQNFPLAGWAKGLKAVK